MGDKWRSLALIATSRRTDANRVRHSLKSQRLTVSHWRPTRPGPAPWPTRLSESARDSIDFAIVRAHEIAICVPILELTIKIAGLGVA